MFSDIELFEAIRVFIQSLNFTLVDREDFLPCLYKDDSYRMCEVINQDKIYVARVEFENGKVKKMEVPIWGSYMHNFDFVKEHGRYIKFQKKGGGVRYELHVITQDGDKVEIRSHDDFYKEIFGGVIN